MEFELGRVPERIPTWRVAGRHRPRVSPSRDGNSSRPVGDQQGVGCWWYCLYRQRPAGRVWLQKEKIKDRRKETGLVCWPSTVRTMTNAMPPWRLRGKGPMLT